MTDSTSTSAPAQYVALAALRDDVLNLTPTAARWACLYLTALPLPDVWATALLLDLHTRAGTEPWPDFDALTAELGWPGCWTSAAFVGDGMTLRLWLAAVHAIAERHAPSPPPAA